MPSLSLGFSLVLSTVLQTIEDILAGRYFTGAGRGYWSQLWSAITKSPATISSTPESTNQTSSAFVFSHTSQSSSPILAAVLETPSIAATVYPEHSQGSSVNYYSQTLNVPPPMPLPGQSFRAILFTLILLVILLLVIVLLYRTVVVVVYPKFQGRDTQSGSHLHPVDVKGDLYPSERPQLMATIISLEGRISKLENGIKESKVQIRRALLASERSNAFSMVDRTAQHQPPNTHLNAASCGNDQGRKPEALDTRQPTSTDYIPGAKDETTQESASKAKAKRVEARRGRTHDSPESTRLPSPPRSSSLPAPRSYLDSNDIDTGKPLCCPYNRRDTTYNHFEFNTVRDLVYRTQFAQNKQAREMQRLGTKFNNFLKIQADRYEQEFGCLFSPYQKIDDTPVLPPAPPDPSRPTRRPRAARGMGADALRIYRQNLLAPPFGILPGSQSGSDAIVAPIEPPSENIVAEPAVEESVESPSSIGAASECPPTATVGSCDDQSPDPALDDASSPADELDSLFGDCLTPPPPPPLSPKADLPAAEGHPTVIESPKIFIDVPSTEEHADTIKDTQMTGAVPSSGGFGFSYQGNEEPPSFTTKPNIPATGVRKIKIPHLRKHGLPTGQLPLPKPVTTPAQEAANAQFAQAREPRHYGAPQNPQPAQTIQTSKPVTQQNTPPAGQDPSVLEDGTAESSIEKTNQNATGRDGSRPALARPDCSLRGCYETRWHLQEYTAEEEEKFGQNGVWECRFCDELNDHDCVIGGELGWWWQCCTDRCENTIKHGHADLAEESEKCFNPLTANEYDTDGYEDDSSEDEKEGNKGKKAKGKTTEGPKGKGNSGDQRQENSEAQQGKQPSDTEMAEQEDSESSSESDPDFNYYHLEIDDDDDDDGYVNSEDEEKERAAEASHQLYLRKASDFTVPDPEVGDPIDDEKEDVREEEKEAEGENMGTVEKLPEEEAREFLAEGLRMRGYI